MNIKQIKLNEHTHKEKNTISDWIQTTLIKITQEKQSLKIDITATHGKIFESIESQNIQQK